MFFKDCKFIELTQPLSSEAPTWNGSCGFCLEIKQDYDQLFRVQKVSMHAGVGTHMDAPSHRFPGGVSIEDLPLEHFFAPACVLDVSMRADADYAISVEDIQEYESAHGKIPARSLVLGYTGWSRFWKNSDAYRNVDSKGQMHFPQFSAQAAQLLLEKQVVGIAIDTLSPDCLDSSFPVHRIFLGAGKYIIENMADCREMPRAGGSVIALPLRMEEATECPIRLVGVIHRDRVETAGKDFTKKGDAHSARKDSR